MQDQLSLFGFDAPQKPTDRLFFALYPDAATAGAIADRALSLRDQHHLTGRPLPPDRFHITLHHLDDYAGLPQDVIAACTQAAASLRFAPFDVTFDHAISFAGSPSNRPFVLLGGDNLAPLKTFHQALMHQISGIKRIRKPPAQYTPHVTLLYDRQQIADHPIAPIRWNATEFVLVHSLLGQTRHIILNRWPLRV